MHLFTHRSLEPEILDDFNLAGNDLTKNLQELERVNKWLGGYKILQTGVQQLIGKSNKNKEITLVDVGCGAGDALRFLDKWSKKEGIALNLIGVDANAKAIDYAKKQAKELPIKYYQQNILDMDFSALNADMVCFNLFMHHFTDAQIVAFLTHCYQSNCAILINDLQRSKLAYQLFRLFSKVLNFSFISRNDGKLSIQKSFTKTDWHKLLATSGINQYSLSWHWAFRYLLLIPSAKQKNETQQ